MLLLYDAKRYSSFMALAQIYVSKSLPLKDMDKVKFFAQQLFIKNIIRKYDQMSIVQGSKSFGLHHLLPNLAYIHATNALTGGC